MVRSTEHQDETPAVAYRDFWGQTKRAQLLAAVADPTTAPEYEGLRPSKDNWFRLRRWAPRHGYEKWPAVIDLCAADPMLGLNENRAEALSSHDKETVTARMRHYLDPDVGLASVDERLQKPWSGFDPEGVRARLLADSPFEADRVQRYQVRPFDMRYAYIDGTGQLWNRARPLLVAAAQVASDFLLVRRRAPRALDGATLLFSRCLVDQHAMHKDAYVIPFLLAAEPSAAAVQGPDRLFEIAKEDTGQGWQPNLSAMALEYLDGLGIRNARTDRASASLLWLHALAIGFSPVYAEENGDAVRSDWPRLPLPETEEDLHDSARLGAEVAALLDLDTPLTGADRAPIETLLQTVATIEHVDGRPVNPSEGDLGLTAGWGIPQPRLVMPGAGRFDERRRTDADGSDLSDAERGLFWGKKCSTSTSTGVRVGAMSLPARGTTRSAAFRCCGSGSATATAACSDETSRRPRHGRSRVSLGDSPHLFCSNPGWTRTTSASPSLCFKSGCLWTPSFSFPGAVAAGASGTQWWAPSATGRPSGSGPPGSATWAIEPAESWSGAFL